MNLRNALLQILQDVRRMCKTRNQLTGIIRRLEVHGRIIRRIAIHARFQFSGRTGFDIFDTRYVSRYSMA